MAGRTALTEIDDRQLFVAASSFFHGRAVSDGEPSDMDPPVVTVRTLPDGYRVTAPGRQDSLCDSRSDALVVLEHALTDALLDKCDDVVHIHASGAVIANKAILALGGSGAGKSSLALAWTLAGYPSLGDDVVLLDEAGRAGPFERYFKVAPAVLQLLGVNPDSTPFWDPSTQEAWYTPEDGPGWAQPASIRLLAICKRAKGSPFSLERASRMEGLNALVYSRMTTGLSATSAFPLMHRVAEDADVLRVRFESAPEAAAAIAANLQ
jgi:hypothetical protein